MPAAWSMGSTQCVAVSHGGSAAYQCAFARQPLYDETDTSTDNCIPKRIDLGAASGCCAFRSTLICGFVAQQPKKCSSPGLRRPMPACSDYYALQRREDMVLLCESTSI
ncbi:MAG: hypothetical protein IPL35_04235 [Sphingobacteriales bacterium]|nr:hypothetical protein [Sphingobacteriales bacterium]